MHMRLKGAAAILLHCQSLSWWWDLHLVPQPPCTTLSRYNNLIPQSSQALFNLHKLIPILAKLIPIFTSSSPSSQAHSNLHKMISIFTNWSQSSQAHWNPHKLIPIFTSSLQTSPVHFFQSSQTTHSDLHKMIPIFTSSFQFSQAYFNLHKLIPIFTIVLIPPILINRFHQSSQAHFNLHNLHKLNSMFHKLVPGCNLHYTYRFWFRERQQLASSLLVKTPPTTYPTMCIAWV